MGRDTGSDDAYRVKFLVQPDPTDYRFRYESEGRCTSFIKGARSAHPTIRITGPEVTRDLMIKISCVTAKKPYYIHPHFLVGDHCKSGYFSKSIYFDGVKTVALTKLGIQCVKQNDIETALAQRMKDKNDPFKQGYQHSKKLKKTDLACIRLCVQVYMNEGDGKTLLCSTVSDPVSDKKHMPKLSIQGLSHNSASIAGGAKMIILCDKVNKDNIKVQFYTEFQGEKQWMEEAKIEDVFKGYAIVIQTPKYYNAKVSKNISAFIRLHRSSDKTYSEPIDFQFTPEKHLPSHSLRNSLLLPGLENEGGYSSNYVGGCDWSTISPDINNQSFYNYNYNNITQNYLHYYNGEVESFSPSTRSPYHEQRTNYNHNNITPSIPPTFPDFPRNYQNENLQQCLQPTGISLGSSVQTQNNIAPFASPSPALDHHPSHTMANSVSVEREFAEDRLFPEPPIDINEVLKQFNHSGDNTSICCYNLSTMSFGE